MSKNNNNEGKRLFYIILCILILLIVWLSFSFLKCKNYKKNKGNINENIGANQIENNNVTKEIKESRTKNYSRDVKIAYENENDKENSKFTYLNNYNKNDYKWNDYIVENKTILTSMPDINLSKFEELEDDFYTLRVSDIENYNEFSETYNFKKLKDSDFDNIFVQIIVMKSSDRLIKYDDLIKGEEFIENKENYAFPVSKGGIVDISEPFKYSCVVVYVPNYMNTHYFNVIVQNDNIKVNKDAAINTAKSYLKSLKYKGCSNFSYMNYIRIIKVYKNDFLITENKENPKEESDKKYTVWSISAFSQEDPCTFAAVYIDVNTGKIIGGKINYATD